MRPDEHKKKKNAAYKKKHGIGQTKAGQSEDKSKQKQSDKNKDGSQAQRTNVAKEVRENKGATALMKEKQEALTSSSDSEANEARQPRKSNFQRRQIVSNWQKYELQPEGEEQQQARGESFETLLSKSGDAVAHFRFKDEQEWDVMGAPADSKINDDHYAQYLNINTQQIGQSMDCLPLHKVLGLNPEVFPNGDVEVMENTAAENRQIYAPQEPTSLASALFSSFCNSTSADQKHSMKQPALSDSPAKDQNSHNHDSPHHSGSSFSIDSNHKTVSSVDIDRTSSVAAQSQSQSDQKLALEDEDLDSLLDLDSKTAKVTIYTNDTNFKQPSKPSQFSDPSKTVTTPASFTTEHEVPVSTKSHESIEVEKPTKDGVDLEDWLDSVLDD